MYTRGPHLREIPGFAAWERLKSGEESHKRVGAVAGTNYEAVSSRAA